MYQNGAKIDVKSHPKSMPKLVAKKIKAIRIGCSEKLLAKRSKYAKPSIKKKVTVKIINIKIKILVI